MTGFIAVHCGAGYHKASLHVKYKKLCKKACVSAGEILNAGGSALDACQVAVMVLEDDPITNAGFGSNLTISGNVECDASIMDGETLHFGACGAVQGVKYPISLASQICKDQSVERPLGLVPPTLLVADGALNYAKMSNLILTDAKKMISKKSYARFKKNQRLLKKYSSGSSKGVALNIDVKTRVDAEKRLDTVGAVCVDSRGHVASASSSGGIFLKYNGRVGQAATYASGIWADSTGNKTENSVAVSTTGTGEYLVKTLLARELAVNIKDSSCPVTAFHKTLKDDFLDSRHLRNIPEKLGGALALHLTPSGHGELMWGHTTKTMGFGYLDTSKTKATGVISQLPGELEGISCTVSGVSFKIEM